MNSTSAEIWPPRLNRLRSQAAPESFFSCFLINANKWGIFIGNSISGFKNRYWLNRLILYMSLKF